MAIADGSGLPVAVHIESASPHEVRLVEATLDRRFLEAQPERLIGDKAYDSDRLDDKLRERGICYEYHAESFLGMVQLGLVLILLRYL